MIISPEPLEIGSTGALWKNIIPDDVYSQLRVHVYYADELETQTGWSGSQFVNHYNRLYYVKEGNACLHFESQTLTMSPGKLYLIPPYTLKSHTCDSKLNMIWVHFQAYLESNIDLFSMAGKVEWVDVEDKSETNQMLNTLIKLTHAPLVKEQLYRSALLASILSPFIERISENTEEPQNQHKRFLPALKYIEDKLNEKIMLNQLARLCNMSEEHFSRQFKLAIKVSPIRYIVKKRIARAQQLLILSQKSIAEISQLCGFCDPYHFSKTFKQELGTCPSDYRTLNASNGTT